MRSSVKMKLTLSFNLLALFAAKKLAFMQEQGEVETCDSWMQHTTCPDGWLPKLHLAIVDGGPRVGKSKEECCVKTCKYHACSSGFVKDEAYNGNPLLDGYDPNSICCDKQCGDDYVCGEGYVKAHAHAAGASLEDCCVPIPATCKKYNCSGPWTLNEENKDKEAQSHEECCVGTCEQYPHCDRETGWTRWDNKTNTPGSTQEECCLPTCSNTALISCSDGWLVPPDRNDWINGTFHEESEESACCRKTCKAHTCGSGWSKNESVVNRWADSDEDCCVPTCGQFECDWTEGWAKDPSKKSVVLATVAGNETLNCCQPTCKQWECPNNGSWMTPTGNYKENLTKQSDKECCAKTCNQHECTDANLILMPGSNFTIGDKDDVCCEPKVCRNFRDPRNKTRLSHDTYCNSVTDSAACLKSYTVREVDKNVTLADGNKATIQEIALVPCYFDDDYKICRYKVDEILKGCKAISMDDDDDDDDEDDDDHDDDDDEAK